jgi:hypothetical protein
MEPTQDYPAAVAESPPRSRSRLKAALAGLALAGMLTTWGAASVLAASPDPSASASPSATTDDSSGTTDTSGDHVCPNEDTTDSSSDATSS